MDTFAQYGDAFADVIRNGVVRLLPSATFLASALLTLGVMFLAMSCLFRGQHLMGTAFQMVLTGAFYTLVIKSVQPFGEGIMESAVAYGLLAGGSSANANAFLRSPDTIFAIGYAKAADLFELADLACAGSSFGCLGNIGSWLPTHAAAWIVFGTFALVAFLVIATAMLFKLALLAGMILLPLAMFRPTVQFGFMPIRVVIHFAVQLMVLAMITAVGTLVFTRLSVGTVPGVDAVTPIILGALVFLGMVLGSSKLAYSLTAGAMLSASALFAAPAGITITAGRSAAGHLDGPATAIGRAAVQRIAAMRAAANRGNRPGATSARSGAAS